MKIAPMASPSKHDLFFIYIVVVIASCTFSV